MIPTADLRAELRIYLDDQGTPPMFTDDELDIFLGKVESTEAAAARLWLIKAARYQRQIGINGRIQTGQETYDRQDLAKLLAFCKAQSQFYAEQSAEEAGAGSSLVINFADPEIL
jgi:hypothetical protein